MFTLNNENEISSCQYYTVTEFLTKYQAKTGTTNNKTENYRHCANFNNYSVNDNFSLLNSNFKFKKH